MANVLKEKPEYEELPQMASAGAIVNGRYVPPPVDKDGKIWVRTSALIQADADELYALWRDLEFIPQWQEQIESVTETGPNTSHWVMKAGDSIIEWDSEILADEPGHRITWRSIGGDARQAGEVIFEPATGDRGTLVTVLQEFEMGKLASTWASIVGRNPKQAVIENLRHFKAFAETGEITRTEPQPHGERGTVGKAKRSTYGENIEVPPANASYELKNPR
jgi:uncharacterized membrane protein